MARPVVIADDLLLEKAREVFLRRGLAATTAEIAEEAGVSQGILFKRFKSKQALFRAAMNVDGDPTKPLPIDLDERVGQGSVDDTLNDLGNLLVKKFLGIIPAMMMDWSGTREESEDVVSGQFGSGPERAIKGVRLIADYLAREVGLGRVRCDDTEVLAQIFAGALWHYAFLQVTIGQVHKKAMTQEHYVEGVVQMLMQGVAPVEKK